MQVPLIALVTVERAVNHMKVSFLYMHMQIMSLFDVAEENQFVCVCTTSGTDNS